MNMKPTPQFILSNERLCIVMIGLPARGKSYMAKKIYRYLRHLHLITKIFNFGSYRRIATKNITVGKASADFFDPDNVNASKIREQCCLEALNDLISWYNTGGQVGILDATNTSLKRRQLIRSFLSDIQPELEYNISILYIESICTDDAIIHENIISVKLKNPDYCMVDREKAIKDFKQRIKMYEKQYKEVGKEDGSYIKVINVGEEVKSYRINDYISCRILYFLMHLHLNKMSKNAKKPLLQQMMKDDDKNKKRPRCKSAGAKFGRPAYDRPIQSLDERWRRQSYLLWSDAENTYSKEQALNTKIMSPPKINIDKLKDDDLQSPYMKLRLSTASPSPQTPIMHRPKVRKSNVLQRLLSNENVFDVCANLKEEDEEYKNDKMKKKDNVFECELCGRAVPKKNTTLVDSKISNGDKVRICEVCLYESDSEDEDDADQDSVLIDEMMHTNNEELDKVNSVTKQKAKMSETINEILVQLQESDHENKHVTNKLLNLMQQIARF